MRGIHPYAYGRMFFCFLFFKVALASNERSSMAKMVLLVDFILWLMEAKRGGFSFLIFGVQRRGNGRLERVMEFTAIFGY